MGEITYQDCLESMFRLHRFGIKLGLDTIGTMLSALGNPQQQFKSIHIAGTNGKGSVAAMLSTILRVAGFKVGRYTSPHLESFNERICIDDEPIDDADVVGACQRSMAIGGLARQPTFFEFTTAMAMDEFARHHVQWAVIETGMGGRLDATNVIQPAVAIITNISLEHRTYLGSTLAMISGEKAGIIKPAVPVITGVRQKIALEVIQKQAARQQAPLFRQGHDFSIRRQQKESMFNYYGIRHSWRDLHLSLIGEHQFDNASLVLAACELLADSGLDLDEAQIRLGLEQTRWPGRLEIVGKDPDILLDGAHNLMSARTLSRHLSKYYKGRNITLVVGILDDKPFQAMLRDMVAPCQRVIITQPKIDRAIPAQRLGDFARTLTQQVEIREDVETALRHALATTSKADVICVAGSLYVVGEAKAALSSLTTP